MSYSSKIKLAAIGGAVALLATACGSGGGGDETTGSTGEEARDDYVIGVSNTLAGNGWREQMICSVKAQALASGNVAEVIAISKNGGPTEQIQDLQNLISQGVDAIIVNPSDPEKLNAIIEEAVAQDIVVVAVDSGVTAESAYVVTNDQVAWGRLGAEWLAEQMDGKGKMLYMRGVDGVQADTDRDEGVQEVLEANPDIEVKEVWTGWDYTKAGEIAVQEFTSSDYDGVWTSGPDYTVVNGIEAANKELVPVVGQDTNAFIKMLIDGTPGAVVTNPAVIGGVGTTVALQALTGEEPEQTTTLTPELWDLESGKDKLEENYFDDRDQNYSSAVQVEGYTDYTNEQLFACKGPGE